LVWEAMQKNKIDYWTALSALKSRIESDDWKKMSIGTFWVNRFLY